MNAIVRRDPLAGMNGMKRFMDRFFDDRFFGIHRYSAPTHQANLMPIDVTTDDKQVVIQASLPGLKPEDVNVSVEDNRLTIEGETPFPPRRTRTKGTSSGSGAPGHSIGA